MKLHRLMGFTPSKESEPIATGFQQLDLITGGIRPEHICTIAARPGMGKTAFAISLLRNIGVIQKVPTAFLSLELDEQEIVTRLKASLTGRWIDAPDQNNKQLPPSDFVKELEKIGFQKMPEQNKDQMATDMMKGAPVWIEHDMGVSMNEIVSRMERLHQEDHVRVMIIDSLQWIKLANTYTEQSQALMKLYQAASKLNMAVVLTSSINRTTETRPGYHRPQLSDMRDWGQIETYSSMVLFVYRPEYYCIELFEDGHPSEDMAEIIVAKNSFGRTGQVRMHFENQASFKEEVEDVE